LYALGGAANTVPLFVSEPESGNIVSGVFTPVLAKNSKSFSLVDAIAGGVDRMQRNFEPMRKQVETWQRSELTDLTQRSSSGSGEVVAQADSRTIGQFAVIASHATYSENYDLAPLRMASVAG